ncbi:hypothetical protein FM112_08730 [Gulosibacter sp. 10]|nr:hypothetical protein FM112_08730 [Gulosibacter sp. 10]
MGREEFDTPKPRISRRETNWCGVMETMTHPVARNQAGSFASPPRSEATAIADFPGPF